MTDRSGSFSDNKGIGAHLYRKIVSLEFQSPEGERRWFAPAWRRAPGEAPPLHGVPGQLQQQDLPDRWGPLLGLPRWAHQVGAQFNLFVLYSNAHTIEYFLGSWIYWRKILIHKHYVCKYKYDVVNGTSHAGSLPRHIASWRHFVIKEWLHLA